jgi:hypothetical protein
VESECKNIFIYIIFCVCLDIVSGQKSSGRRVKLMPRRRGFYQVGKGFDGSGERRWRGCGLELQVEIGGG